MTISKNLTLPLTKKLSKTLDASSSSIPLPLQYDNLIQWALDKNRNYQSSPVSNIWYLEALESTIGGKTAYPMRLDVPHITFAGGYGSGDITALADAVEMTIVITFKADGISAHEHLLTIGDATNHVRVKSNTDGTDTIQGYLVYDGTVVNLNPNNAPASIEGAGWHTVVFSIEDGDQKLYLDGTEVASASTSLSGGLATSTDLLLGAYIGTGSRWDGPIADVRFYNSARTPTTVEQAPLIDLIAWYPCQDGDGLTVRGIGNYDITLTGDTAADFWANKEAVTRSWSVLHGGRMMGTTFIPGDPTNPGFCVNGDLATTNGGKFHEDNATLVRDPLSNAALDDLGQPGTEFQRKDIYGWTDRLISIIPGLTS